MTPVAFARIESPKNWTDGRLGSPVSGILTIAEVRIVVSGTAVVAGSIVEVGSSRWLDVTDLDCDRTDVTRLGPWLAHPKSTHDATTSDRTGRTQRPRVTYLRNRGGVIYTQRLVGYLKRAQSANNFRGGNGSQRRGGMPTVAAQQGLKFGGLTSTPCHPAMGQGCRIKRDMPDPNSA